MLSAWVMLFVVTILLTLVIISKEGLKDTVLVAYLRKLNILNLGNSGFTEKSSILIKILNSTLLFMAFLQYVEKPRDFKTIFSGVYQFGTTSNFQIMQL